MGNRLVSSVLAMGIAWPALASAEPDNRPADRFFFAVQAGATGSSADQVAEPDFTLGGVSVGYETSFWPNDYLGFGLSFQLARVPATAALPSGVNVDLGVPLLVGLPLRYVQPYAGAWLGLAHTYSDAGGQGIHLAANPVVGMNGYVNRNLRVYLQWQSMSFDCGVDAHAQLVVAGARWSPEWFHPLRGAWKFQTVWWSMLGTFVMWGAASLALGN